MDFGHAKISDAIFSGQSLLLNTTVLNDNVYGPNVVLKHYSIFGQTLPLYCAHSM